jgi:hypothetical protein
MGAVIQQQVPYPEYAVLARLVRALKQAFPKEGTPEYLNNPDRNIDPSIRLERILSQFQGY